MLHATAAGSKLLGLLAPVSNLLVVDDVIGSKSLELIALGSGRSSRDDLCAGRFGELHGEHAHAAGALGQDPVAGLEAAALQAVQAVPRRETGTGESAALQEIEVGRHADEALLVESAVLLQGAVDGAADSSRDAVEV